MKTLLAVLLFSSGSYAGDLYLTAGTNPFRSQSYNLAVGYEPIEFENSKLGMELEFVSCGEQPSGYENINRMANINVVAHVKFSERIRGFGKFGANNTNWSHNGTNTYDRSGDSLWGWNASVGAETPITDNLMIQLQVTVFEYRQVNNPNMGGYTYPSIGLRYIF